MRIYNNNFILPENSSKSKQTLKNSGNFDEANSFKSIFNNRLEENPSIHFSKHASMRLNDRNVSLSSEQIKRVESGINKASQKGINDSLVLVDDIALVVNVKNKVVITAMNSDNENIFTNIDGAVIV